MNSDNSYQIIKKSINVGSTTLLEKIKELKQLKIHIFGHIHNGYGDIIKNNIHFYNVSLLDEDYKLKNNLTYIEI